MERRESVVEGMESDERMEKEEQRDVERDREELAQVISRADNDMKRVQTGGVSFGPAFGFGFGQGGEGSRK